ncbi:MAG: hypothetical protein OXR73_32515 [Myxococcales bacterium]|nr:hypothetical protein [Myxococcales bacterium]
MSVKAATALKITRNDQHYSKRRIFWDFYTGEHGLIPSIYTGVPVSLIPSQSVRRYSIEHIIPKSFLKARLEGAEEKGATVNPLNFAAAERDTNSFRGRFDFDFEGDSVVDHPNIGNLPGARLT